MDLIFKVLDRLQKMASHEGNQNDMDCQEIEEPLYNFPRPTSDTLTKEYLKKLIEELNEKGESDPEVAHYLEKAAMICFIINVVAKKYSPEEASELGQLILDIQKIPFSRWFA
jgi:hypothetical protein